MDHLAVDKMSLRFFAVICGELWLIFGFSGIRFGLPAGFLRVRAPETMCYCRKNVDKLW